MAHEQFLSSSACLKDIKTQHEKYSDLKDEISPSHKVNMADFYWSILKDLEVHIDIMVKDKAYLKNSFIAHELDVMLMRYISYYPEYVKACVENNQTVHVKVPLSDTLTVHKNATQHTT